MDRDWLYDEYVVKNRRPVEIASEYGCSTNNINCWLIKHGIKKPITTHVHEPTKPYEFYEYLYHEHIELHKSMAEIARENGVSGDTIRYNLKKNGITPWQTTPHSKFTERDIDQMVEMYRDKRMSANEISKVFGTSHKVVIEHMKRRGVDVRGLVESQYAVNGKELHSDLQSPELLYDLHWNKGLSCKDIGEMYGIDAGAVRRQMHRIGVTTKTNSESKIGLMVGNKHPNWKGGITPLSLLLREFFHTNQAPSILKRDEYTCQLCGKKHDPLHVHHIVGFSSIVSEICQENRELNPANAEDRLKLYDIITHDKRFLDEDNLITFCRNCHFFEIHNYSHKTISSQASYEEGSETIPIREYTVSD